jgi:hypothetical protein
MKLGSIVKQVAWKLLRIMIVHNSL